MNYYIQGDAAKADQIKAAFEKLGYDVKYWRFFTGLFYTLDGKIVNTRFGSNEYKLVLNNPDYKELELPVEQLFKVGDWLYHNTCGVHPILVKDYSKTQGYKVECISSTYYIQKGVVENEYHLWSIADAKDGDVLATDNGWACIFQAFDGCLFSSYCFIDSQKWFCEFGSEGHTLNSRINGNIHPATKEQRGQLFAKMKEAGYTWDEKKKELRKIHPHYDIANFYAGMEVLVREYDTCHWQWVQYSHFNGVGLFFAAGKTWRQCIPFNDDTKHLLGTTDKPSEEYINW